MYWTKYGLRIKILKTFTKRILFQSEIKKEGQTRSRGRGRGRDRGRGRGHPDVIKSSSIFSEGPGAKTDLGSLLIFASL